MQILLGQPKETQNFESPIDCSIMFIIKIRQSDNQIKIRDYLSHRLSYESTKDPGG